MLRELALTAQGFRGSTKGRHTMLDDLQGKVAASGPPCKGLPMATTFVPREELLGHKDVRTTVIYTHVLNRGGRGVRSPADGVARAPDER